MGALARLLAQQAHPKVLPADDPKDDLGSFAPVPGAPELAEHPPIDALLEGSPRGLPVAIIDTETTGIDTDEARIVEVAVTHMELGESEPRLVYSSRVRPDVEIPEAASKIHGITDADVAECPTWAEVVVQVHEHLRGRLPLAYNAPFDQQVLRHETQRAGVDVPGWMTWGHWLDPLRWVHHVDQYQRGKRLEDACGRRGIELHAHGAGGDTVATGMLVGRLLTELARGQRTIPRGAWASVASLLGWQRDAALAQETDFVRYLARRARPGAPRPDCPWHELEGRRPPPWEVEEASSVPCKSCGRAIRWAVTQAGKQMPLHLGTVGAVLTPDGQRPDRAPETMEPITVLHEGQVVRLWPLPDLLEGEQRIHAPEVHWGACPGAEGHRRAS